jgi:L-iditol 2-dehydrogenase
LPDAVGLETGALAEPLAACVQAVCEVATFSAGDVVLLSGPGPIGLLCLALLRAQGCRVIVAGTAEDGLRLGIARDLGAYRTVTVPDEDLQAVVECQTGGMGVDAAVECAGVAASVAACLEAVRPMGQHLQIGIVGESIPVPLDLAVFKQITVHGTIGHSFRTWDAVIRLMAQGELDLSPIITHRLPLSDWREAFDLCERKQCGKVLLRCSE